MKVQDIEQRRAHEGSNRFGGLLLAAILCGALFHVEVSLAQGTAFIRGDFNGDGSVNVADAHHGTALLFFGTRSLECFSAGDVNGDGTIDISDTIGLLVHESFGGAPPCAPFPEPGEAPDSSNCQSYGGGSIIEDDAAKIEIVDAVAAADGTATLVVQVSSSTDVGGFSGTLNIAGGVLADVKDSVDLFEFDSNGFLAGRVIDGELRFGYLPNLVNDDVFIPGGSDVAVMELSICLAAGTAAGAYDISFARGVLVDQGSSQTIAADLVAGTLTVPTAIAVGCDVSTDTPASEPQCEASSPDDDPDGDGDPPPPPPGPSVDFVRGDINADGQISTADSLMLRRFLFLGSVALNCLDAADVNDDGDVDISDVIFGLVSIFQEGPEMPAPFLELGPDPTADGHNCAAYDVIPPEETADTVRFGVVEAVPGGFVDVPVFVSSSVDVEAFQLLATYDEDVADPVDLVFEGTEYESRLEETTASAIFVGSSVEEGIFDVGFVPSLVEAGFELAAGTNALAFKVRFRIAADAVPGTVVEIGPPDGPVGPYELHNELTFEGESRFVTVLPNVVPGEVRIVSDITIFRRGDANRDGEVDIADANFLLNALFVSGEQPTCPDAADSNDDGGIDISDPINILNSLFVGTGVIPAPFDTAGVDPTPDALGPCNLVGI